MINHMPAPWSPQLKRLTIISAVVLAALNLLLFSTAGLSLVREITAMSLLLIIPFAALFLVRSYAVDNNKLHIKRLIWTSHYSLDGLQEIEVLPNAMQRSWMLFGNRGLFAYAGLFRNRDLGCYRAWATDMERTLVLRFHNKRWIISPLHPMRFAQQLQASVTSENVIIKER